LPTFSRGGASPLQTEAVSYISSVYICIYIYIHIYIYTYICICIYVYLLYVPGSVVHNLVRCSPGSPPNYVLLCTILNPLFLHTSPPLSHICTCPLFHTPSHTTTLLSAHPHFPSSPHAKPFPLHCLSLRLPSHSRQFPTHLLFTTVCW
jgi:hypothetical protein